MTAESLIDPIYGNNLSEAWSQAFVKCWNAPGRAIAPGLVSFNVQEEDSRWGLETPAIRQALEKQLDEFRLRSANQSKIETVAGTIFPQSIWIRCNGDREQLFHKYEVMWPQIERCPRNRRGTYFRRLTAYGKPTDGNKINQLREILKKWESGNHCHSALQTSVFDPNQDHVHSRIPGFPCLQQVVFHPIGPNGIGGMNLVAFYANQLLLEKAYGNYLGLFRLGRFMAVEMGLKFSGVTCIASNLKLSDNFGKRDCAALVKALKKEQPNAE